MVRDYCCLPKNSHPSYSILQIIRLRRCQSAFLKNQKSLKLLFILIIPTTVSLYLHFRASAIRFLVLTFCLALTCETKPVAAASLSVVASRLDNVRGLSFGPDGSLYITEAGVGGDRSWVLGPGEENNPTSVGTSAAVTRIKDDK